METRINYVAVGLFVLVLATLWVAASIWLMFGNPRANYEPYVSYFTESVSGLVVDAPVNYRGVQVGKVKEISLRPDNPEQVQLVLDIRRGAPIKTDTKATLRSQGLTGLYYVELIGGSKEAPPLEAGPGGGPPVIESEPSLFMRLDQAVTGLLDNLDKVSTRLSVLLSDENMDSLQTTMANVAELSSTMAENREDIGAAIGDARRSMADLNKLTSELASRADRIRSGIDDFSAAAGNLSEFSARLPGIMDDMKTMVAQLKTASGRLDELAESGSSALDQVNSSTVADFNQTLYQLRSTLASLERLSAQLQAQPDSLIYGERKRPPGPGENQ